MTTKIKLIENLSQVCEIYHLFTFDITPITYILDLENPNIEYVIIVF